MFIVGLVFDAAIIATVLVIMTEEFPGWGALIGCVLAIGITSNVVGHFLPWPLSLLGLLAGAAVGALVISWACELPFRRSMKAAGIYVGVRVVLTMLLRLTFGA